MRKFKRLTMTLALLIMAVSGAWAQSTLNVVELVVPADWENDNSNMTAADLPGFNAVTLEEGMAWTGAPKTCTAMLIYAFDGEVVKYINFDKGNYSGYVPQPLPKGGFFGQSDYKFYYPTGPAEPTIEVTWNAATKTGNFTMPASNVELQVEYEPELTALFKAGNANTIQGGKATVTVTESGATEGTNVTDNIGTDGKLTPVYEGQTITLTAAAGYKFKSVEAKKGAASGPEVTTFSELQTALSAGKDVKLMNDIVCTEEIEINSDGALTIDGNGKTLSTTSAIRAFTVKSSATVAFKNLTFTGFVNGGGPAINNSGTIVLDGCTISNCHVNNNNGGGAIESSGKLYAINTTFSGNFSGEIGGAINNSWGSLYMIGCTFTNNYTTSSNAFYGGAIGINRGSEVRLINCVFSGNKYGTNTGTNDIGVFSKPANYTIAGCTGATIAPRADVGDITTNASGTATLDYSDLSNISFTYTAE